LFKRAEIRLQPNANTGKSRRGSKTYRWISEQGKGFEALATVDCPENGAGVRTGIKAATRHSAGFVDSAGAHWYPRYFAAKAVGGSGIPGKKPGAVKLVGSGFPHGGVD